METAILARHGETEFNVRGAVNGNPARAEPHDVDAEELERAVAHLEAWTRAPTW